MCCDAHAMFRYMVLAAPAPYQANMPAGGENDATAPRWCVPAGTIEPMSTQSGIERKPAATSEAEERSQSHAPCLFCMENRY
jgi:hypothetical protein